MSSLPGGRLVSVVSPPDDALAAAARQRPMLSEIGPLFVNGALQANIGEVLPLAEAPLAHEMLAGRRHRRGKIVLDIDFQF
jgi:NADPH:quinone reductase-like Zn-dependent oxidoreductase